MGSCMVSECRDNLLSMTPTSLSYPVAQIKGILQFLEDCGDELIDACRQTHFLMRIFLIKYDCYDALKKKMSQWTQPMSKPQPSKRRRSA